MIFVLVSLLVFVKKHEEAWNMFIVMSTCE